jgi:RNA polymerase sigma factor (sigma-70 family)
LRARQAVADKDPLTIGFEDVPSAGYLAKLRSIPLLNPAEEQRLGRLKDAGDAAARSRLIEANLRLVVWLAWQRRTEELSLDDLVQEGSKGLIVAVDRFDYRVGTRFSTFAFWPIQNAITEAVRRERRQEHLELKPSLSGHRKPLPGDDKYSLDEVRVLVEEYARLYDRRRRMVELSEESVLIRLCDVDRVLRRIPFDKFQIVEMFGLNGHVTRDAPALFGIHRNTAAYRYRKALEWMVAYLNEGLPADEPYALARSACYWKTDQGERHAILEPIEIEAGGWVFKATPVVYLDRFLPVLAEWVRESPRLRDTLGLPEARPRRASDE